MKRELKKEELGKVYKEFSRQKYIKYKHQYPRMRENQLVAKIIKEWETLNPQEKLRLYESYQENKQIKSEGSQSSEKKQSPGSSKQKKKKKLIESTSRIAAKQSSSTPSKKKNVQVFNKSSSSKKQKDQQKQSDFDRDGQKKDVQISQSDSQDLGKKVIKGLKKKKITKQMKQPKNEYIKFFKFYYEKLSKEHKKWSSNQISTIIKLLWKKKLYQDRLQRKANRTNAHRQLKKISGRLAFRKNFGYNGLQGFERWKQLPKQSKDYWKFKGQGTSLQRKSIDPNITFKSTRRANRKGSSQSMDQSFAQKFSYLVKQIP